MPIHDPQPRFKWPVAAEREIAVSAERVWEVISMPGNLEKCHPHCARNPASEWPGPRSRDEVHYLNGLVYQRRFYGWHEGVGYDLEIGKRGGDTSTVSWRINPIDSSCCRLSITVNPSVLQHIPVAVRWAPHIVYLHPKLKRYLQSVVAGFEWYLTRGEAVPKDHFGRHPWFSAPE